MWPCFKPSVLDLLESSILPCRAAEASDEFDATADPDAARSAEATSHRLAAPAGKSSWTTLDKRGFLKRDLHSKYQNFWEYEFSGLLDGFRRGFTTQKQLRRCSSYCFSLYLSHTIILRKEQSPLEEVVLRS